MEQPIKKSSIEKTINALDLISALVGLARAAESNVSEHTINIIIESLALIFNDSLKIDADFSSQIDIVRQERIALAPMCHDCASPCGRTDEYDVRQLFSAEYDAQEPKFILMKSLVSLGYYYNCASKNGYSNDQAGISLCEGLFLLGYDCNNDTLFNIIQRLNKASDECIEFNNKF